MIIFCWYKIKHCLEISHVIKPQWTSFSKSGVEFKCLLEVHGELCETFRIAVLYAPLPLPRWGRMCIIHFSIYLFPLLLTSYFILLTKLCVCMHRFYHLHVYVCIMIILPSKRSNTNEISLMKPSQFPKKIAFYPPLFLQSNLFILQL